MTSNDHYPTDFEMADDMAEFGVEHASELAALDRAFAVRRAHRDADLDGKDSQ